MGTLVVRPVLLVALWQTCSEAASCPPNEEGQGKPRPLVLTTQQFRSAIHGRHNSIPRLQKFRTDSAQCDNTNYQTAGDEWRKWVQSDALPGGSARSWPSEWQPAQNLPHVVILITLEMFGGTEANLWTTSFFCDLRNVGVLNRTVVFALNQNAADFAYNTGVAQVIYSDLYYQYLRRLGERMRIKRPNRLSKLLSALVFLDAGHTVVVSDADMRWTQSPLQYLQSIHEEVIGMNDLCWLEVNSGFLVYKPTKGAKALLHSALGFIKYHNDTTDTDQYAFNCAMGYHGYAKGLRVRILDDQFIFASKGACSQNGGGCGAYGQCQKQMLTMQSSQGEVSLIKIGTPDGISVPVVMWHTSGMSGFSRTLPRRERLRVYSNPSAIIEKTKYFLNNALFAGWGLDAKGKCLQASVMNDAERVQASLRWRCLAQWAPRCTNSCSPTLRDLQIVLAVFGGLGHGDFQASLLGELDKRFLELVPAAFKSWSLSALFDLLLSCQELLKQNTQARKSTESLFELCRTSQTVPPEIIQISQTVPPQIVQTSETIPPLIIPLQAAAVADIGNAEIDRVEFLDSSSAAYWGIAVTGICLLYAVVSGSKRNRKRHR